MNKIIKSGFATIKIAGKLIACMGKCPKHKTYKGILYPRSECKNCLAMYRTSSKAKPYKHKFQIDDVIATAVGPWRGSPSVILGYHVFPDGQAGYRLRTVVPQRGIEGDEEHMPDKDGYMWASYIDSDESKFKVIWRKRNG